MPDTKITALTALTAADPANDVLPIVDVSDTTMAASGTTKKISINNVLGCSGTATLASATITGNLTVDTNTLFVDSANNRVGIGTATPSAALDVNGASNLNGNVTIANTGSPFGTLFVTGSALELQANSNATNGLSLKTTSTTPIIFSVNSAEAMRLNSTGLGIGVTPSAWGGGRKAIQIASPANIVSANLTFEVGSNWWNDGTNYKYTATNPVSLYSASNGLHAWYNAPSGTAGNNITFTQAMTLAANGQLLLGTSTTEGSIDIGMVLNKPSATGFVGNSYQLNGSSKAYTYISSAAGAFRVDTVTGYTINMISATNGVYLANGGTSWTALSDERFKDIIEPISNAVAKVGSIRSVIGKFKTESEGTRRSFLIAQDVQAVLPEAVDASNPEKLGVSYTEVIPLLVAAIKELTAEVNALKNA